MLPLEDLRPWEGNYRHHPAEQLDRIRESLRRNGQRKAVVVQASTMRIVAGHGVAEAMRLEGAETVRCDVWDCSDEQAAAYLVDDNELSRHAVDDEAQLAALLLELQDTQFAPVSFNDAEIEALLEQAMTPGPFPEPAEPDEPPVDPVTKLGDVWLCGKHRVVCGDCTDAAVVDVATGGERVSAILTDPPYQMDKDITGDSLSDDDFKRLHERFVAALPAADACTLVSFHSPRTFLALMDAARDAGWNAERCLWYYKPNNTNCFPWRGWIATSEIICVLSLGGGVWQEPSPYSHDCYQRTTYNEDLAGGHHPTVKPVGIVNDILSRIGNGAVFDPFLGSGTTLIAAEQLGRVCYGIEIEPRYVDVAVRRWMKTTGNVATLEATGEVFPVVNTL